MWLQGQQNLSSKTTCYIQAQAKIPAPEDERITDHDILLQLDIPPEERAPEVEGDSPPRMNENHLTNSTICFYCELCKHKSESAVVLHGHMSLNHNPLIPHTGKWEDNKCQISYTAFNNTCHFKTHFIEQHGFSDISNECMNCEIC